MAQAKPARGSHPHDCNADVLSIQYNTIQYYYTYYTCIVIRVVYRLDDPIRYVSRYI